MPKYRVCFTNARGFPTNGKGYTVTAPDAANAVLAAHHAREATIVANFGLPTEPSDSVTSIEMEVLPPVLAPVWQHLPL